MTKLDILLGYLPSKHGEHGVDATIHMLSRRQSRIHEVFCNPPGGSWSKFDILKPESTEIYRWDHMPRVPPEAKRPDTILQFNRGRDIHLLLLESKRSFSDFYPQMGILLKQYFTGSRNFIGLKDRPAWHRREISSEEWTFIPPDADENIRYWFKNYDRSLVHFWSGFAFAISPEYYADEKKIDVNEIADDMERLLQSQKDLHVTIAVGWRGPYHCPFVLRIYSKAFEETEFARILDSLLKPVLYIKDKKCSSDFHLLDFF